jgi:hypothetical protein
VTGRRTVRFGRHALKLYMPYDGELFEYNPAICFSSSKEI